MQSYPRHMYMDVTKWKVKFKLDQIYISILMWYTFNKIG